MVAGMSRDELVSGLVRIGEMMVTGEDQAEIDAYFAPDFTFHGPDGGLMLVIAGLPPAFAEAAHG